MNFQLTSTSNGIKTIVIKTVNQFLKTNIQFKQNLLNSTKQILEKQNLSKEEQKVLNENVKNAIKNIQNGKIDAQDLELLKNENSNTLIYNSELLKDKNINMRTLLQKTGDVLRNANNKVQISFLAYDLLKELENRNEKMNLSVFMGIAGSGKDTLSSLFNPEINDKITDLRTPDEVIFVTKLKSLKTLEDQKEYLKDYLSKNSQANEVKQNSLENFDNILASNINEAFGVIQKYKSVKAKPVKFTGIDEKIKYISRQLMTEDQFEDKQDYENYINNQQKVYEENEISFTKENQLLYGHLRNNVPMKHFTEKLNLLIKVIVLKQEGKIKDKQEQSYLKEIYEGLKEDQLKQVEDFYKTFKDNQEVFDLIENKDLKETKNQILKEIFKSSISNSKGKYDLVDYDENTNYADVIEETIVYFDFDDVIVNFIPEWLKWTNERTGRNDTMEDVKDFYYFQQLEKELLEETHIVNDKEVNKYTKEDTQKIIWDFLDSDIYAQIEKYDKVISTMKYLKQMGVQVMVLSAGGSDSKYRFIKEHLPFLHKDNDTIMAGKKDVVNMGVLVDDGGHNHLKRVETNTFNFGVVIEKNHNKHIKTGKRLAVTTNDNPQELTELIFSMQYSIHKRKQTPEKQLEFLNEKGANTQQLQEALDLKAKLEELGLNIEDLQKLTNKSSNKIK